MLNHYQKTYIAVLAELISKLSPSLEEIACSNVIHEKIGDTSRAYLIENEPNEDNEQRLCDYLVEYLDCVDYTSDILAATGNAKILTQEKILSAPYRVASDFSEAAGIVIDFVHDENRQSLMFGVETGAARKAYAYFKLPFNDHTDFLYGDELSCCDNPIQPEKDMKYLGFYNRTQRKAFCLESHLADLYWFHHRGKGVPMPDSKSELRETIKKAIRQSVARRIAEDVLDEPSDTYTPDLEDKLEEAKLAYAKGEAVLAFEDKIDIQEWHITRNDYSLFIDDPDTLVSAKTEQYLKDQKKDELRRLWVAHCVTQQLLDQIIAAGGLPSEWISVHKPLSLAELRKRDGKAVFAVANSEYHNCCKWRIVQVSEVVGLENAPLNERGYERNWIAFDHEPPKEIIEAWQSKHNKEIMS